MMAVSSSKYFLIHSGDAAFARSSDNPDGLTACNSGHLLMKLKYHYFLFLLHQDQQHYQMPDLRPLHVSNHTLFQTWSLQALQYTTLALV